MRKSLCLAAMIASSVTFANMHVDGFMNETSHKVIVSPGAKGGVERTHYKFWKLSEEEMHQNFSDGTSQWVSATAKTDNTSGSPNKSVKAIGNHHACYRNTSLQPKEGSYKFTFVTMNQNVMAENKMTIKGGHGFCIDQQTYLIIVPPTPGNYETAASSKGILWDFTADSQSNAALDIQ